MGMTIRSTYRMTRPCCGSSASICRYRHEFGCGAGLCGACTVHLNGEAVRSCQTAVSQASGKKITTIEGLDPKGEHPLQRAWIAEQVPQCGYCQSGQIMQGASL